MNNGGARMKNMKIVSQGLLCLILVFSFTYMVDDSAPVVAGEESSLAPVTVTALETVEVELSLQAGWNMVSVPLILTDSSTSAVFPGVDGFSPGMPRAGVTTCPQ
jgi:hypothetical protein